MGSGLGDAHLAKLPKSNRARFQVSHSQTQSALVQAKFEILKDWCGTPPKPLKNRGHGGSLLRFTTLSRAELLPLWEMFYPDGGPKRIGPEILEAYWTPQMAAWWVMDDGSHNGGGVLAFHTENYIPKNLHRVAGWLTARGYPTTVRPARKYWVLYLSVEASERLAGEVRPYILPSMLYKIAPALERSEIRQRRRCLICQKPLPVAIRLDGALCSDRCKLVRKTLKAQEEYHGRALETPEEVMNRLYLVSRKWKLRRKSMTYRSRNTTTS